VVENSDYQSKLNIKTLVLIRTPFGYIFEKDLNGCYFLVGKHIQMGETCHEAIKKGVLEEVGHRVTAIEFIAVYEQFLSTNTSGPLHEIDFIYKAEVDQELELPHGYHTVLKEHISKLKICPNSIKSFIMDEI
jgi:ADP-ribose pyrophosphatase YjhB (NUDIX family)